MMKLIVALLTLAVLGQSTASMAQCPVTPGWWVYENLDNSEKIKFHVKESGTSVDSLEFTLHNICSVSGTRRFTCPGKTISCSPWRFTWAAGCNPSTWTDGFNLEVIFTDAENSMAVLDIVTWYNGCAVCRAVETAAAVGAEASTWGIIKSLYRSR